MKSINLFIKMMLFTLLAVVIFFTGRLLAAEGTVDYNLLADAGFTLLEQILIFAGVGGGGLAVVLIRIAREGTKTILKSLDSNPYVDNRKLHLHAVIQKDKKAIRQFEKIKDS